MVGAGEDWNKEVGAEGCRDGENSESKILRLRRSECSQSSGAHVEVQTSESKCQSPKSKILFLPDAPATRKLGITLGQQLPSGTVLLLEGDLGSGKTTLVQGIGEGLGIGETIDSPTFTLVNEYLSGRIPLYHLDLYRLEPSETVAITPEIYWEGMEVELGIVAIEWAERLPYQPQSYLQISLTYAKTSGRLAIVTPVGQIASEILDKFSYQFKISCQFKK
ncbi:MAG: tRNA (adenosine(37)-N6)-threonylcarbamoyltransferase complex ATPase subunit type 1 TsaE [Kovacikia sp.]